MPRHLHTEIDLTPAAALRAAMQRLAGELRAAPPDRAGDLARRLAAVAKDLAVLEEETPEQRMDRLVAEQQAYDAEVRRLIGERALEGVDAVLEIRGMPTLSAEERACLVAEWNRPHR